MFTSYFAKYKGSEGVSIAVSTPVWAKCKVYPSLAPTWELVKHWKSGKCHEQEYKEIYLKILFDRKITQQQVLNDLGDNAVLLCYEKSSAFCHRHIVSEWLREFKIKISEL